MQQTKTHLSKLCSAAELAIVENSLSPRVKELGSTELKKYIKLVRKLRDKNRDLYQRQTLDSKKAANGAKMSGLNIRTKEKSAVFDMALKVFEARLSKMEVVAKKSKKVSPEKPPARKTRKNNFSVTQQVGKTSLNKDIINQSSSIVNGFESRGAQDNAHRQQLQQSYSKPIQGHIKSAGKRAQAKRDSK